MNEADKFLQEYLEKANRNTQKTTRDAFSFESSHPKTTQQQNRGASPFGVNARVQQQKQTTYTRAAHTEVKSGVQYAPQQGVQYEVSMCEAWKRFWSNWSLAGRSSRSEVWKWILWAFLFWILLAVVTVLIGDKYYILQKIFLILITWPTFALQSRRLHDIGRTCLLAIVFNLTGVITGVFTQINTELATWGGFAAFILGILILCVYLTPSQPHENKYGLVPNVR